MNSEKISIKGMHCTSCVNVIEDRIRQLNGVKEIKVSLEDDNAVIKFDPNKIDLNKIKSEISFLGYNAGLGKKNPKKNTILQGLAYGLIPHIGCIFFIIGSILGVTVLMQFFRPLLMNRYFFHILILISLMFATLSSGIYLRKNKLLSFKGLKKKWKYLVTMYGSTIGINLILFLLIFPLLANVTISSPTGAVILDEIGSDLASITLKVDIPCPGHAPLISEELKTLSGLVSVNFNFPNIFDVKYDSSKNSKQDILSLEVFNEYPAIVLEKPIEQVNTPSGGGSCCGASSCSISGSGCGCGG